MPLEILVGAVVGAGLASSPVRKSLRKGLVYSMAGALKAYDKVASLATEARKGFKTKTAPGEAETEQSSKDSATAHAGAPDEHVSDRSAVPVPANSSH